MNLHESARHSEGTARARAAAGFLRARLEALPSSGWGRWERFSVTPVTERRTGIASRARLLLRGVLRGADRAPSCVLGAGPLGAGPLGEGRSGQGRSGQGRSG